MSFTTPTHSAGAVDVNVIGPSGHETESVRFTYA
jgi:hypothetical protein